jgi:hypothetical protein
LAIWKSGKIIVNEIDRLSCNSVNVGAAEGAGLGARDVGCNVDGKPVLVVVTSVDVLALGRLVNRGFQMVGALEGLKLGWRVGAAVGYRDGICVGS